MAVLLHVMQGFMRVEVEQCLRMLDIDEEKSALWMDTFMVR